MPVGRVADVSRVCGAGRSSRAREEESGADDARDGEEEQGAACSEARRWRGCLHARGEGAGGGGGCRSRRRCLHATPRSRGVLRNHPPGFPLALRGGGDGAAAMASAHGEHRQHGERVCVDCRPPERLELEVRAHDVLAWGGRGVARREGGAREARRCWVEERWYTVGHLDRDDEEVGGRPRVRVPPVELEGRVGEDVPRRADDQDEQRAGRRRRGQLAAEEEVVELRDDEGDAGAEDYDRLDVRVLQRLWREGSM